MNLIFRKFSPLYCLCIIAGCLIFTSCEDVVRRLDDKYRPVEPELMRSVTVITDGIDSSGVPLRLTNLDIADLELKATDAGGAAVPFTPKLEADKTHEGLAYIRIPPNGNPTTEFSVTVDICSKADGTVYASHTFTADTFPWRVFKVDGETYKFEQAKMFHFDQNRGNFGAGSGSAVVVLFTGNNDESKDVNEKGTTVTICDQNTANQRGTGLTFCYSNSADSLFRANTWDYVEIKFKSAADQTPQFALLGESDSGRFGYWYSKGFVGVVFKTTHEPAWKEVAEQLLSKENIDKKDEESLLSNTNVSYVFFYQINNTVYACTGGYGSNYISKFVTKNFGLYFSIISRKGQECGFL